MNAYRGEFDSYVNFKKDESICVSLFSHYPPNGQVKKINVLIQGSKS